MTEFDTRRDYTKIYYILQAIEQGIQAWESVDSTLITRYWERGFRGVKKEPENSYWAESLDLIPEIQEIASTLANSDQRIKELMDSPPLYGPSPMIILDTRFYPRLFQE